MQATVNGNVAVPGLSMPDVASYAADQGLPPTEIDMDAGLEGELTTRTDNDTGVVTLDSGHGITANDTVSIAWQDADGLWQNRYTVDVTAAGGTTINIDLGFGDNLPTAGTTVYVDIEEEYDIDIPGSTLVFLALCWHVVLGTAADAALVVTFLNASRDVVKQYILTGNRTLQRDQDNLDFEALTDLDITQVRLANAYTLAGTFKCGGLNNP